MKTLQTSHGKKLVIYTVTDIEGMTDNDIIKALSGYHGGRVTRNGNTATAVIFKRPLKTPTFKTLFTIGG